MEYEVVLSMYGLTCTSTNIISMIELFATTILSDNEWSCVGLHQNVLFTQYEKYFQKPQADKTDFFAENKIIKSC